MNIQNSSVFVSLAVSLLFLGPAFAQSPKAASRLLNGWDRNKNGLLETSEIPAVAQKKVETLAQRNGLDTTKALPIDKLLAKPGVESRSAKKIAGKKSEKSKLPRGDQANLKKKAVEKTDSQGDVGTSPNEKADKTRFGGSRQSKGVAGFGKGKRPKTVAKASPEETKNNEENGKDSAARRRLRFFAKSMMAQHDSNRNGKLDKSEWSRLRGNPGASDRNRDGVLTSEELENHLAGFGSRDKDRRTPSKAKSSSRPKKTSARKTYRFLTPHERLPKGIPSWFTDQDTNLDGQLTLREYTSRLSQAKLDKFRAFDLNDDGLIVPSEYLKSVE